MIDPLGTWQSTFLGVESAADFANWIDERVTGKAELTGIIAATPANVFVWDKATFQSGLEAMPLSTSQSAAMATLAGVWESSINGTVVTIAPGDSLGAPTPATIWSVVTTSVLDPASITAAKAALQAALISAAAVDDKANSDLPQAFRDAFLLLTATVTGLDSTPIPVGPLPLIAANAPLL